MRLKFSFTITVFAVFIVGIFGSCSSNKTERFQKDYEKSPKLVIGIVVDQMRYDYLFKYWNHLSEGGLKRLLKQGFSFDNALYDYAPTYTGPGHASVHTGTTPAYHGIISNDWFIKQTGKTTNVVEDKDVQTVGSDSKRGQASPKWLLSTTISDELRISNNMQSKSVGVAIKDRAAILPSGFTGQAYWYDKDAQKMITSTFYRNDLPDWLNVFNERNLPQEYVSKPWETLYPIDTYIESVDDENEYEGKFKGETTTSFPHNLPVLADSADIGIFMETPFGNTFTFELAKAAIEGEQLGTGKVTDFLSISFSSTDMVAHRFAPTSKEVQDTYIRFDRDMEKFLTYLDQKFGKENFILFLTADHAGAQNPKFAEDNKMPTGNLNKKEIEKMLRKELKNQFGFDPIRRVEAMQIYLDNELIRSRKVDATAIQESAGNLLISVKGVAGALTANELRKGLSRGPVFERIQKGYNASRSGDVLYWVEPQWFSNSLRKGTTHGSPWSFDARVPILFYGWDIPAGNSTQPVGVIDIASTVANFLNIPYTSGNIGQPLNDIIYGR